MTPSRGAVGPGSCRVRTFEAADEPGVIALWERVFPDDRPWNAAAAIVRRKTAIRDTLFWIAETDGRVIGAVMAGWDGQRGWIYHLAVEPERRRHGVGRALVETVEARLARLGCPKINLQVQATNADVVAFYERLGYRTEPRISMGKTVAR